MLVRRPTPSRSVSADLEAATELSQQVQQLLQKGTSLLLEEVLCPRLSYLPDKLLSSAHTG